MSVPESIAWLETSRDSHSPSLAQLYATTILGELHRLHDSLEMCAREVEKLERLRADAVSAHRTVDTAFGELEESARTRREEWDAARTDLETRLTDTREKLNAAETMLRDTHFALLNQPDLKREEIANAITSVVTPYRKGEKE